MKSFFEKYDYLIWGTGCLIAAFVLSANLAPFIGIFVFVGFFLISMGMYRKFWEDYQKGKKG